MKKVNLEKSSQIKGGWSWSQHAGCGIAGALLGGGFGSAATYASCLLLQDNDCSLCCGAICG